MTYAENHDRLNLKMTYVINSIEAEEVKTMSRMDGTGLMGLGARTGLGRGACAGNPSLRKGIQFVHGFGRRMGLCRMLPGSTKDCLLARKSLLQEALNAVEQELAKM